MRPLLLLHGALGSRSQLAPLKSLLQNRFEVYDLDFAGHGDRATFQDFSLDLFADNVVELMDRNNLSQVDIFGYSMGGYVALKLAHQHPEKIGRIATLGTKFDWTPETAAREVRMLNPQTIQEKVPAYADHLKQVHSPDRWEKVLAQTAQLMVGLGNGAGLSLEEFSRIPHTCLIGIGDEDRMVSLEETTRIADALPQGKLRVMEGFPHPLPQIDTDAWGKVLLDFFSQE